MNAITRRALRDSVRKLDPRLQIRNPVMFVVWICAVFTTGLALQALLGRGEARFTFILAVSFWLWITLLFANFAEALAEGRGKAQAESLRRTRRFVTTISARCRAGSLASTKTVPGPAASRMPARCSALSDGTIMSGVYRIFMRA